MHSLLPSHNLQRHSNWSVRFPPPAGGASACRLPHQHPTRLSTEDTPFFFKAPAPVVIRASELHSPFSHHKAGQPSCGAFTSVSSLSSSSYSAWPAPRYSLVLVTLRASPPSRESTGVMATLKICSKRSRVSKAINGLR